MKLFRQIALTTMLTIGAFSAITYTSCNKDKCKDVTCSNGGTCNSTDGTCTCPTGTEGTTCATLSRDRFIGVYTGTETCTLGTDNYTITLTANSDVLKLTYTNVYNAGYTAICNMTGTHTFSFSGTQSGATFTGTATLVNSTITVDYTITDAVTSNTCKFIGSK